MFDRLFSRVGLLVIDNGLFSVNESNYLYDIQHFKINRVGIQQART